MKTSSQLFLIFFEFILVISCHKSNPAEIQENEVKSKEISFQNDTLTLSGTLTIPTIETTLPAVIIIPGSGAVNKDGIPVGGKPTSIVPIYKEWSEYFAEQNIASLRYNKRFISYPSLKKEISLKDMAGDVVSAFNFLKDKNNIQSRNIYLIGHSQGGNIAPIVRNFSNINISGYSLIATTSIAIDSLLIEQLIHNSQASDSVINKLEEDFWYLRQEKLPKDYEILGVNKNFWKEWILYSQKADSIAKAKKSPILILQGNEDENFPDKTLSTNINRWKEAAKNEEKIRFKSFDDATHRMLNSNTKKINKKVLSEIVGWIKKNSD